MNLHLKTGLGNKNYVLDPNSDVENDFFLTDFLWQFWAKNTKINFSSESVTTEEHQESYSCYFSIYVFYKINLRPILKKILQKIDFRHFPFCPFVIVSQSCLPQLCSALKTLKSKVSQVLSEWVSDKVTYWVVLDTGQLKRDILCPLSIDFHLCRLWIQYDIQICH